MSPVSLVDKLGGPPGVQSAVIDLYERLLDDHDISDYFDDVNLLALRVHMVDFLIAALSGAQHGYHGRPLDEAHRGLGITDTAFDHVVGHLRDVLIDASVDREVADHVVDRLAPLRQIIVS